MKIRLGFVTNSSSSSFIIAYKKFPTIDDETLEKYPWLSSISEHLFDFIKDSQNGYETETAEVITDKEDLDYYFKRQYDWGCQHRGKKVTIDNILEIEGEPVRKLYEQMKEKIESGYCIMEKRVGYDDSVLMGLISQLADDENIILLDDREY